MMFSYIVSGGSVDKGLKQSEYGLNKSYRPRMTKMSPP